MPSPRREGRELEPSIGRRLKAQWLLGRFHSPVVVPSTRRGEAGGRTGGGDGTPKTPCARPQQRTGHCTTPCAATGQQPEEAWRVARPVNAHSDHPVTAQ